MPLANRNDSLVMTWRKRWKVFCGTNKFFTAEDNTLAVSHERLAIQQHVQQDVRVEKDSHLASLVQTMVHRIVVHPHIIRRFIGCEPHTAPRAPHPFASLARSSLLDRVYPADLNKNAVSLSARMCRVSPSCTSSPLSFSAGIDLIVIMAAD